MGYFRRDCELKKRADEAIKRQRTNASIELQVVYFPSDGSETSTPLSREPFGRRISVSQKIDIGSGYCTDVLRGYARL